MAGTFPFDRDIFSDLEFLPSDVTDRFVPGAGTDNLMLSRHQQLFNKQPQVSERPSSSTNQSLLNVTPENIRPFTKAASRKRNRAIQIEGKLEFQLTLLKKIKL